MNSIAYQMEFRPVLPTVFGAKEYQEFRETLEEIDRILTVGGLEHQLIMRKLRKEGISPQRIQKKYRAYQCGLRYCILLSLTGYSYRELSIRAADGQLFQWFTCTNRMDVIRPLSKSSIERYEKIFTTEEIASLIHTLNRSASDETQVKHLLHQEENLQMDGIFADTTCVKSNIHFPVDWVLFRDAARSVVRSILLIRKQGLYHRIGDPQSLLTTMNRLCIGMTHTRKKKDGKKERKRLVRKMKKHLGVIERHGWNYYHLLTQRWEETEWSEAETQLVLARLERILTQIPAVVTQAHERIIGERRVPNACKILSLYEQDVRVLVRGKAGAEVEFGNALYLAEQRDGLIVDWQFIQEQAPSDTKLVMASIERIQNEYGPVRSYAGDRGFDSRKNSIDLEALDVINAICPRSVPEMSSRLEDPVFCQLQTRRGATEARIGIFKNAYLGKPLRSKGFLNRSCRIHWCILGHNLWKLAAMAVRQKKEQARQNSA